MEKNKTKILAIGDLHGDQGLVRKLAEKAEKENVDLVILAGDLTLMENSTKNIIGPFIKKNKRVLLIHGNHESIETIKLLEEMYPNTKNLHGYYFIEKSTGIFGAGGADIIPSKKSEKELFELLKRGNEKTKHLEKRIMVTHIHPSSSTSDKLTPYLFGSASLLKAIKEFQPDIAIHGHVHEASGMEEQIGKTRVINVARKESIFEI